MKHLTMGGLVLGASLLLAACGGGSDVEGVVEDGRATPGNYWYTTDCVKYAKVTYSVKDSKGKQVKKTKRGKCLRTKNVHHNDPPNYHLVIRADDDSTHEVTVSEDDYYDCSTGRRYPDCT